MGQPTGKTSVTDGELAYDATVHSVEMTEEKDVKTRYQKGNADCASVYLNDMEIDVRDAVLFDHLLGGLEEKKTWP